MSEGKKFDQEKPPMQLLASKPMIEVAKVLAFGAKKYDSHNWRKGISYSRIVGACYRHLAAFNDGEDLDPETQLSHVAHLMCEAMFLLEFIQDGRADLDDRYKPEAK